MTRHFGKCKECGIANQVDAWGVCQECNDKKLTEEFVEEGFQETGDFDKAYYDYEEDDHS